MSPLPRLFLRWCAVPLLVLVFGACGEKKREAIPPWADLVKNTERLMATYPTCEKALRLHLVGANRDWERAAAHGSPEFQNLERTGAARRLWDGVSPLWKVDARIKSIENLATNFDRMTLSRQESPLRHRALQDSGSAIDSVRQAIFREEHDSASLERNAPIWMRDLGQAHMELHQAMRGFQNKSKTP